MSLGWSVSAPIAVMMPLNSHWPSTLSNTPPPESPGTAWASNGVDSLSKLVLKMYIVSSVENVEAVETLLVPHRVCDFDSSEKPTWVAFNSEASFHR